MMELVGFELIDRRAHITAASDVYEQYMLTGIECKVSMQSPGKPAIEFTFPLSRGAFSGITEIVKAEALKALNG